MIFTIYTMSKGDTHVTLGSNSLDADEVYMRFLSKNSKVSTRWQSWNRKVMIDTPVMDLVNTLSEIAFFVNNELGDECMFEVECLKV